MCVCVCVRERVCVCVSVCVCCGEYNPERCLQELPPLLKRGSFDSNPMKFIFCHNK